MCAAAAQVAGKRRANFGVAWLGVGINQGFCRNDDTARAIPALRRLLGNEGALQRVWMLERAQPFDRSDRFTGNRRDRHVAGWHRITVNEDHARPALCRTTAE